MHRISLYENWYYEVRNLRTKTYSTNYTKKSLYNVRARISVKMLPNAMTHLFPQSLLEMHSSYN